MEVVDIKIQEIGNVVDNGGFFYGICSEVEIVVWVLVLFGCLVECCCLCIVVIVCNIVLMIVFVVVCVVLDLLVVGIVLVIKFVVE